MSHLSYSDTESYIVHLFSPGTSVYYRGEEYTVLFSGKPMSNGGEPKTDVYVLLENTYSGNTRELKVSVKKHNADFLENKISLSRAKNLFGETQYLKVLPPVARELSKKISQRKWFDQRKNTATLGYRLDVMNKKSGALSVPLDAPRHVYLDILSGNSCDEDKRHAYVNGQRIAFSGVATHVLQLEENMPKTAQQAVDTLVTAHEYTRVNPNLWLAAKAVNLREGGAYEKSRPLFITMDYHTDRFGKISATPNPHHMLKETSTTHYESLRTDLKTELHGLLTKAPAKQLELPL